MTMTKFRAPTGEQVEALLTQNRNIDQQIEEAAQEAMIPEIMAIVIADRLLLAMDPEEESLKIVRDTAFMWLWEHAVIVLRRNRERPADSKRGGLTNAQRDPEPAA